MNINTKAAVIYAAGGMGEKEREKRGRSGDSILRDSLYVAVSVYAPDFSTSPRAFEVLPCWELTNFYDETAPRRFLLPCLVPDFLKNDL